MWFANMIQLSSLWWCMDSVPNPVVIFLVGSAIKEESVYISLPHLFHCADSYSVSLRLYCVSILVRVLLFYSEWRHIKFYLYFLDIVLAVTDSVGPTLLDYALVDEVHAISSGMARIPEEWGGDVTSTFSQFGVKQSWRMKRSLYQALWTFFAFSVGSYYLPLPKNFLSGFAQISWLVQDKIRVAATPPPHGIVNVFGT